MITRFKKKSVIILIIILLAGFAVRFYRFDNPVADWHSWRQADTAAVARNFIEHGFDLLHPRMNNISNVQSGLDNPQGYFFVEFPIYNATYAGLYKVFGGFTLIEWGRIVTMLASVFAGLFLYLIVSRHSNKTIGLLASFFYLFIPFDIYYGRVILPDTSMVMATLGAIYFFDRWIYARSKILDLRSKFFVLTVIFSALAFLLKPYALFFVLPMAILAYQRWKWRFLIMWQLWFLAIISVAPLAWWRVWMLQYPAGIPASAWLFNGNGIRFHPAFFRWLLYERLTKLITGYVGMIFLFAGIYRLWQEKKERLFFFSFIASSLVYVCTIATGNVQHDYYQILVMPSVAICMAFGVVWLFHWIKIHISSSIAYGVTGIAIFLSLWFGWQQVQPYFDIDNPSIIAAGKAVRELTPKNAKIIANYNGDSSLLYQTDRQGWASFEHSVPRLAKMGADYLILVNPTTQDMVFAKQYKVIAHTKQYVIFDLQTR